MYVSGIGRNFIQTRVLSSWMDIFHITAMPGIFHHYAPGLSRIFAGTSHPNSPATCITASDSSGIPSSLEAIEGNSAQFQKKQYDKNNGLTTNRKL